MATLSATSSSWSLTNRRPHHLPPISSISKNPICRKTLFLFSSYNPKRFNLYVPYRKRLNFYVKAAEEDEHSTSSVAVASEENDSPKNDAHIQEGESGPQHESESESERIEREKQQEMDWKTDEEFKKFMGNPSIEAAIKLEKKRADRKLKELDSETTSNPLVGFFKNLVRDSLSKEKERLEKAEEAFVALDLNKVIFCSSSVILSFLEIVYAELNSEFKVSQFRVGAA